MDIDLSALRSLEAEKDISMDLPITAIEDALLASYHRPDGAAATARVEINRGSGHVTVWAAETAEDGAVTREYDDTPAGFGRIAAPTARRAAAAPPRPRLSRSSCGGCATRRMSLRSASTRAARVTSWPA